MQGSQILCNSLPLYFVIQFSARQGSKRECFNSASGGDNGGHSVSAAESASLRHGQQPLDCTGGLISSDHSKPEPTRNPGDARKQVIGTGPACRLTPSDEISPRQTRCPLNETDIKPTNHKTARHEAESLTGFAVCIFVPEHFRNSVRLFICSFTTFVIKIIC